MVNVLNRISKDQYHDLVTRRRQIKSIAQELGVSPNYLGRMVKERAPKQNSKALKKARMAFQMQIAKEILDGKYSITEGSSIACVCKRTMFRRLAILKAQNVS